MRALIAVPAVAGFLLAALSVSGPTTVQAAALNAAGKVTFYKGKVFRAASPKGPWKRLKRNKKFFKGDYIRTESSSRVELKFKDRSLIRLGAETTLELHEAFFAKKGGSKRLSASVKAGRAWANVNAFVGGSSAFDLRSDNAVAGVRGTVFSLTRAVGATEVAVWSGSVAVDNSPYLQALKARKKPVAAHRRTGKAPIKFGGRKEVSLGLREISAAQWEQLVGGMQKVAISSDGSKSSVLAFTEDDAKKGADADWIAWNRDLDVQAGLPHSEK
jgi:hypothetical protein